MKENLDTTQEIKTSTSVSEKIAVLTIILGAFSVGIGLFLMVPLSIIGGGGGEEETIVAPQPLIPTEITNAMPNERDTIGTFFSFYRESNDPNAITLNNVLLAVYEPAHSGSDPWDGPAQPFTLGGFKSKGAQNIIGNSPLEIKMQKLGNDNAIFPATLFTLTTNTGVKTICLPETTLTGENPRSYFYDNNSTPYTESLLINMAISQPCNELLAKAYKPTIITKGILNKSYPPQTPDNFQVYAIRPYSSLGIWSNDYNEFIPLSNEIANSNSPLVLTFGQAGENPNDPILLPERALILTTNLGTLTLCMPVINVPAGGHISYAYDNQGNPYSNGLLQNKVNCKISSKFSNPYRPTY